ncbi:putative fatty acyl-CoA reductase CG5065 [Periplaneta americana]|uniref:putative fatty acyl-CoA reductase CG5065 n=1 Tax=Periplaneta americana TaxID=6978 RepID=UPI0037E8D149
MTVITDWYRDQTILVTGGTGFMGKVLLEKLLRSCPGVRRIYVLARAKRGATPSARIEAMAKIPLFEQLVNSNPEVLKKLVAVECDLTQPELGLQKEQKQHLISEVTVVFNMAASLRLEAGMKAAVTNNTTGTKRILDLCAQMKQLKAFVHLSTAFCHCEYDVLGEKMYPPPHNPHDVMRAMEWLDDKSIELLTPRLLGPHPNCYTYSKRLAETLVYEYRDRIPVCIARPAIVIAAHSEPIPGWVDTLNGPTGILVGAGKGVIRTMMCGEDYSAQVVPVDIAINGLILTAWKLAAEKIARTEEVPVYNISSGDIVRVTWGELVERGRKLILDNPFETTIWYPDGNIRSNWLMHYFCIVLFHYLPAYFIDFLMLLARQKRFMVRLQNRISVGLEVLQYFTMRQWQFSNEKFLAIEKSLCDDDRKIFYITNVDQDIDKYMTAALLGARVYCMKEPLSSLPRARRILTLLYYLHIVTKTAFCILVIWLLLNYVNTARLVLDHATQMLQDVPAIGGMVPHDIKSVRIIRF